MSHYAEIDSDNKVIRVLVGNPKLSDEDGLIEITNLLDGTWIQTSYNGKIRGNYAGIGYTYLSLEDIFMPPKCHAEAVLDAKVAKWLCDNPDHDIKDI
jgi:hypothetical protein